MVPLQNDTPKAKHSAISALQMRLTEGHVPERNRVFAKSLVAQYSRRGFLSERQWPWVQRLTSGDAPEAAVVADASEMSAIFALFQKAGGHLKYPAIVLAIDEDRKNDVRLSIAGARSRFPGSVNVALTQEETFAGRIQVSGQFEPSASINAARAEAIASALKAFAAAPAEIAAKFGKLRGRCCFCTMPLRDEISTAVGYGPQCAKHYGLPHNKKAAAA